MEIGHDAHFIVRGLPSNDETSVGRDTLNVTAVQDYGWMWTNKGSAPVNLTVDLAR